MQDSKTPTENWHSYWLIAILALAASVRFYVLGENNLSAEGLLSISFCNTDGWFAMTEKYTGETGLPFLYPTLLCQFSDFTAAVDFFIRALSVVLGIGVVFMVYLFGARFFSPITGLLAALLMAVDSQSILIDRSVTPYSLFALLCLAHLYVYCCLLWDAARRPAPLDIGADHQMFQWKLRWAPNCPCHAGVLLLFWLSGFLVCYTNPTALIVFVVEAIGIVFFVDKENRKLMLGWLLLPILVCAAPYLLTLTDRVGWALKNDLFGFFSLNKNSFFKLPLLASFSLVGLFVSLSVVSALLFLKRYSAISARVLVLIAMLVMASIFSLLFIKLLDPRSFLFCAALLSLVIVEGFSRGIVAIKQSAIKKFVFAVIVIVLAVFQIQANTQGSIYRRSVDMGFEWAAQIIANDGVTKVDSGKRMVLMNSRLFQFYFDRYGITQKNTVRLKEKDYVSGMSPTSTDFYYVEYVPNDAGFTAGYPVYEDFSRRYKKLCQANKKRFRITRFSVASGPAVEPVANCSDYLKVEGEVL